MEGMVTVPIKDYLELRDFKQNIENNKVHKFVFYGFGDRYNNYFMSISDALAESAEYNKSLQCEIDDLKRALFEKDNTVKPNLEKDHVKWIIEYIGLFPYLMVINSENTFLRKVMAFITIFWMPVIILFLPYFIYDMIRNMIKCA